MKGWRKKLLPVFGIPTEDRAVDGTFTELGLSPTFVKPDRHTKSLLLGIWWPTTSLLWRRHRPLWPCCVTCATVCPRTDDIRGHHSKKACRARQNALTTICNCHYRSRLVWIRREKSELRGVQSSDVCVTQYGHHDIRYV